MVVIAPEPEGSAHTYRVEIWSDPPEAGGELLEIISLSTSFIVSVAAQKAAVRERPGKYVIHWNGRHYMGSELAPDPPAPLQMQEERPPLTFSTLPEWNSLAVECRKCRHLAPLDRWELSRKLGKNAVIASILPKLRCKQCGSRGDGELKIGTLKR